MRLRKLIPFILLACQMTTSTLQGNEDSQLFPQFQQEVVLEKNLLDGAIFVEESGEHPYWEFDETTLGVQIIELVNGLRVLTIPEERTVTTYGPLPCPISSYKVTVDIFVPGDAYGQVALQFSGIDLFYGVPLPIITQSFYYLTPGKWNTVLLHIPDNTFASMEDDTFFRPIVRITNLGDQLTVTNAALIPYIPNVWDVICTTTLE